MCQLCTTKKMNLLDLTNLLLVFTVLTECCMNNITCPLDRPYCTSVGCVFECPESMYMNGTECVSECGNRFVNTNSECVDACSKDEFIFESVKTSGTVPYLEKKCVITCPRRGYERRFIVNNRCVETCPVDFNFIDADVCLKACPVERLFSNNITLNGIGYHKCVKKCNKFSENGFCTSNCSAGKVVFNSKCVAKCPDTHPIASINRLCSKLCNQETWSMEDSSCLCPNEMPYFYNNTCVSSCQGMFITQINDVAYCSKHCTGDRYVLNDTCIETCPNGMFAYQNSCVTDCPDTMPYTYKQKTKTNAQDNVQSVCQTGCPSGMFANNYTCVNVCPMYTVNNVCLEICPKESRLTLNRTSFHRDSRWERYRETFDLKCVKVCPNELFLLEDQCVRYCPSGYFLFNKTCVQHCSYFVRTKTYHDANVEILRYSLSHQDFIGKECLPECPENEVIYNHTCFSSCPVNFTFITNQTCHLEPCSTNFLYNLTSAIVCTDTCDNDDFVYFNTCVESCPPNHVVFNNTCLPGCPDDYQLTMAIMDKSRCESDWYCKESDFKEYIKCVDQCPSNYYVLNRTCVQFCPLPLVTNSNACINACPSLYPYIQPASIRVNTSATDNWDNKAIDFRRQSQNILSCVHMCRMGFLSDPFNQTCVTKCPPSHAYIINNTCSTSCPEFAYQTRTGIECVLNCPADMVVSNGTCVTKCPSSRAYIINNTCSTSCPEYEYQTRTGIECVLNCPADMVVSNGTCVTKCPSSRAYIINNTCSTSCLEYAYQTRTGIECVLNCPADMVVSNGTCVTKCPSSRAYIINNTCSTSCSVYTYKTWRGIECVHNCSANMVIRKGLCVPKCQNNDYFLDGICLSNCPRQKPLGVIDYIKVGAHYMDVLTCTDNCPWDKQFNNSCVESCPEHTKYSVNNVCVNQCPKDHPIILKDPPNACISQCERGDVLMNYACVTERHCNKTSMVIFERQCITQCPESFVLIINTCMHIRDRLILLCILTVALVGVPLYTKGSLIDYFKIVHAWYSPDYAEKLESEPRGGENEDNYEMTNGLMVERNIHTEEDIDTHDDSIPLLRLNTGSRAIVV